jgi:hypothetical protein
VGGETSCSSVGLKEVEIKAISGLITNKSIINPVVIQEIFQKSVVLLIFRVLPMFICSPNFSD